MALISRDTVSRRVLISGCKLGLIRRRVDNRSSRIIAIGTRKPKKLGVHAAANVERAEFSDPAGHRAIARDQRRDDRFAERAVGEHCLDEDRTRHFRHQRIVDRENTERTGAAVESSEFAKERTRFHVVKNEVLPDPVQHCPKAATHDEIDVVIICGLTENPGARRRLKPCTIAVENPARFGIEGLETRVRRKRIG